MHLLFMNMLLFLVDAMYYTLLFAVASDFVGEFVSDLDHDIVCVCVCVYCVEQIGSMIHREQADGK